MIQFICPSCSGKCTVGDEFAGRKLKCPKCKTRIRHHADGPIELLTVGEPPPAGSPAPAKESTVAVAVVPELVEKLVGRSESQQNAIIAWGAVGVLAAIMSAVGLFTGDLLLATIPIAVALTAVLVWLALRLRAKGAVAAKAMKERAAQAPPTKDEEKTEPLPIQR